MFLELLAKIVLDLLVGLVVEFLHATVRALVANFGKSPVASFA